MMKEAADMESATNTEAPVAAAAKPSLKPYHEPRVTDCGPLVELTRGSFGAPGDVTSGGTVT